MSIMDEFEKRELKKETLRAISRVQHRLDQIGAHCRDEGREPTEKEWLEIAELLYGAGETLNDVEIDEQDPGQDP